MSESIIKDRSPFFQAQSLYERHSRGEPGVTAEHVKKAYLQAVEEAKKQGMNLSGRIDLQEKFARFGIDPSILS